MDWRQRILAPLALWMALTLAFAAASPAGLHPTVLAGAAAKPGVSSTYRLYRLDQSHGVRLIPIDASRLTPIKRGRSIAVGGLDVNHQLPSVQASDDGGTVVAVRSVDGMTHVLDGRTGKTRANFRLPPEMEIGNLRLSREGSILLTSQKFVPQDSSRPETWYVVSAKDGRIESRLVLTQPCCVAAAYSQTLGRLFTLQVTAQPDSHAEPGPPRLLSYDAASGGRISSLTLDDVRDGTWRTGTDSNGAATVMSWTPGFALSPNGRQLAVFDDSSGRLIVFDAGNMRVLSTGDIARPMSMLDRMSSWLGLAPTIASAKEYRGASLEMRYSPDGKLLYVTGYEYLPGAKGLPHSIGIRAIDIATHQLVGESIKGQVLWWMQPAPDGRAVYTLSPLEPDAESCPCVLRRHDPKTLRVITKTYVFRYANPQFFVLRAP